MKSKIIGLIIGVVVLSGLIFTSLSTKVSESPTIATSTTATVIATTTVTASTTAPKPSAPAQTTSTLTPTPVATPEPKPAAEGYTMAQVAAHPDRNSCWSSVNGKVYDLTDWISEHPGGSKDILSICGKDGSRAFNNEHGGDNKPEKILASYYIGLLIK